VSFAAALRGRTEQQHRPQTCQVEVAGPVTMEPRVPVPLHQYEQHAGQSVGAPIVNSLPLNNSMLRTVATAVYDRIQWCSVRGGENSGHYKNCLRSHEAK
jgi:hypothetical protein